VYSIIEEITKKSVIVLSLLFLSGCSTFDVISSSLKVIDIVDTPKPTVIVNSSVVKKPQHNWNYPKSKPVVKEKEIKQVTKPTKEERSFPWWALILAIVSGTAYIINRVIIINKR